MAFECDKKRGVIVDHARSMELRPRGGRADQSYNRFLFSTPDCAFTVTVYYSENGITMRFLDSRNEYGKLISELEWTEKACIYLMISGLQMERGDCDPGDFKEELREALVQRYSYCGRFAGPIYFQYTGQDGRLVSELAKR